MRFVAIAVLGAIAGFIAGIAITILGQNLFSKPLPVTALPPSTHPDLSITASATFVSSQLQPAMRQSGIAKNATVTFAVPNLVRVAAAQEVNVLGFTVTLNVTATLRVLLQNGRIVLKTESIDSGRLLIPQAPLDATVEQLRAQAEDQLNRVVQSALRGTNLHVSAIRMTESEMTVELSGR